MTRMKTDYEANTASPATLGGRIYKFIKGIADAGTSFWEYGGYATWMYQATGDTGYAVKAWAALNRSDTNPATTSPGSGSFFTRSGSGLGSNFGREFSIELVLLYDWLYPGLSGANQTTFLNQLNTMFTYQSTEAVSLTAIDSDQTTGTWLGLRSFYQATGATNPTAVTLMNIAGQGTAVTAADYSTKRNAINYYVTVPAAGGEWCESSEYNTGSTRLLTLGAECLKTTSDATAFTDVDALVPYFAQRMIAMSTADDIAGMQWGDEQSPRIALTTDLYKWWSSCAAYIGALPDGNVYRQQLQRYLLNSFVTHGEPSAAIQPLLSKACFLYDPYATASADLTAVPKGFYASGQGMTCWHNERTNTNEAFYWSHYRPEQRKVDHIVNYFGDFQMYRRGEMAITHPIAYSANLGITGQGVSYLADMVNCTTIESESGFPSTANNLHIFQFRRVVAQKFGTDYAYTCGTQGGLTHVALSIDGASNYFDPPPVYCHEHSRSLMYLPTADGSADSIVVFERINAEDPEALAKFARYRTGTPPEQALIQANARWASYLHHRTNPVLVSLTTDWLTAGGQLCKDEWLSPTAVTITVQDETALSPYDATTAEKKYRTKTTPNSNVQWNVLLRVVSVRNSGGVTHASTLLTGTNSSYGALVTRLGNDDRIVLFNGIQGANITAGAGFPSQAQCVTALLGVHLRATGYTMTWTQATATAKVIFCDLDPAHSWFTNLDGAGATDLTVDSNGIGELTVSGTGAHSLVVS